MNSDQQEEQRINDGWAPISKVSCFSTNVKSGKRLHFDGRFFFFMKTVFLKKEGLLCRSYRCENYKSKKCSETIREYFDGNVVRYEVSPCRTHNETCFILSQEEMQKKMNSLRVRVPKPPIGKIEVFRIITDTLSPNCESEVFIRMFCHYKEVDVLFLRFRFFHINEQLTELESKIISPENEGVHVCKFKTKIQIPETTTRFRVFLRYETKDGRTVDLICTKHVSSSGQKRKRYQKEAIKSEIICVLPNWSNCGTQDNLDIYRNIFVNCEREDALQLEFGHYKIYFGDKKAEIIKLSKTEDELILKIDDFSERSGIDDKKELEKIKSSQFSILVIIPKYDHAQEEVDVKLVLNSGKIIICEKKYNYFSVVLPDFDLIDDMLF